MKIYSVVFLFTLFVFGTAKHHSCHSLLNGLGGRIALYTQCVVDSSFPVTICLHCYQPLEQMQQSFKNFTDKCSNYTNQDRLNGVVASYENALIIWENAFCSDCFKNGSVTEEVKYISRLLQNVSNCFENVTFCESCFNQYSDVNKLFNEYVQKHKKKVCFDMEDRMNKTRMRWSENCSPRKSNLLIFFPTASLAMLLPVVFYSVSIFLHRRAQRCQLLTDVEDEEVNDEPNANTWAAPTKESVEEQSAEEKVSTSTENIIPGPLQQNEFQHMNLLNFEDSTVQ